jgi:hypothetical protein
VQRRFINRYIRAENAYDAVVMLKRLFLGLAVWQACLVAAAAVTLLMGSEVDASVLVPCALAGVAVAAVVTLSVQRLTRTAAAISGFAIGLLPSIAGTIYGWFFQPKTIDATAGWLALSFWLAAPSALGGALCGVFSSQNPQPLR